jgi:hypothetical protein
MKQIMIVFIALLILSILPVTSNAATQGKFKIYDFIVEIRSFSIIELPRSAFPMRPNPRISFTNPISLNGKIINGNGTTTINGKRINVFFRNIRLKYVESRSLPEIGRMPIETSPLVAVSGFVKGSSSNPSFVSYPLYTHRIFIDPKTVYITPKQAIAITSVRLSVSHFSTRTTPLYIHAPSAYISSDGSVAGVNFRRAVTLSLLHSPFTLKIRSTDNYKINLGSKFPVLTYGARGIHIVGRVIKDNVEAFMLTGSIKPNSVAVFRMILRQPFDTRPDSYFLHVKQGKAFVYYKSSGDVSISGAFLADITIPPSIKNDSGSSLSKLVNVNLKLDNKSGLYEQVVISEKVRIGQRFVYEADEKGAFAYFPTWTINGASSHYNEKPRECERWRQIFTDLLYEGREGEEIPEYDVRRRPGITLTKGIVYFDSPQITDPTGSEHITIKSRVSGALTMVALGVVGPMSGANASFVPAKADIISGDTLRTPIRASWKKIIDSGARLPEELKHRFKLADLRILDMQLKEAYFCLNEMDQGSAKFHYSIHFPHPSYIHLLFEDDTLNLSGRFSSAKGPIAPATLNVPDDVNRYQLNNIGRELPKDTIILPNPDTHILWAWRLPISFSDRGVHIKFHAMENDKSDIEVRMFTSSSTEQEGVLSASQIKAVAHNSESTGVINSSEMWLKPLYSKNSAIKKGVRFGAKMKSTDGSFNITKIDRYPFMAPMYAEPGHERKSGFLVHLNGLAQQGFKLVSASTDPVTRERDYSWKGRVQFPFFNEASEASWEQVEFFIKDQLPRLDGYLSMSSVSAKFDCTTPGSGVCSSFDLPSPPLRVNAKKLGFNNNNITFVSTDVESFETKEGEDVKLDVRILTLASYINAELKLDLPDNEQPYSVDASSGNIGECGRPVWTRSIMLDWQPSENQRDLVCYDQDANCARGECGSCKSNYVQGTYEVRTRKCATLGGCMEKTIIQAYNAKFYPDLKHIDLSRSDAAVTTDSTDNPYSTVLNIPSAQIALSEDGRFIEGAFGATYTQVAASLPYEGFFSFKLDNKCGYYYFHGGGSFTYAVTFRGQTFIVNAPYEFLKQPPPFFLVTPILETLRIRALYDSTENFIIDAGLGSVEDNTIISGFLTSGNVISGWNYEIYDFSATAGPGLFLYQFKNPGHSEKYRIGTFLKIIGGASVDIELVSVEVTGTGTLATRITPPTNLNELEAIRKGGDFTAEGSLEIEGCASATIGHCKGTLSFPNATYDTEDELGLGRFNLDAECDWGSCP